MIMMRLNPPRMTGRGRALGGSALLVASTVLFGACSIDDMLTVDDIDVTTPDALLDPANIEAVRALGIGDFAVAFGGAGTSEGVAGFSGVTADEFHHIGSWQWIRESDTRIISEDNSGVTTVFRALHRARVSTGKAIEAYETIAPNTAAHAEQVNLHAYTYVFFAENFCSGIPFSQSQAGIYTYGQPLPTDSVYNRATATFDRALALANQANSAPQRYLAQVGKARALMGLNRYAEAAALVADVPSSFVYNSEHSENTGRQNNGIFAVTRNRREYGLSHREGGNGVAFRQEPADPRVPWTRGERAFDTMLRAFEQAKYPARGTSIVLASGIEATLIRAEAALNRGQSDAYLTHLNSLRAGINLPALSDPGAPAARVDQFFTERAMWLFGTGNRLSDLRRLVRQYGRSQETVFPTGTYTRELLDGSLSPSGTYGSDVNWPVPFDERNNPLFQGCLNRDA
jgi:starch-binding outer membrane protein, SusD/RagB family